MKQIKLPKINWDKVLPLSAAFLVLSMMFALLTRSRTILILVQFLDVAIILGLLGLVAIALANKKNK